MDLKKEEEFNFFPYAEQLAGTSNQSSRKKYKDLASKLEKIVESYGKSTSTKQWNVLDYLESVAMNI